MIARLPGLLLGLSLLPPALGAVPGGSSTPEERQRVVAIAHKLEAAPLDQTLYPERDWARQWVVENPDVRIRMCLQLIAGLKSPRYKYRPEIGTQMMLSSAAFLIEHSDKTGDHLAENFAGLEGVLKAYSAILKAEPNAHATPLDNLLQKQSQGKLMDYTRETIKMCRF